MGSLTKNIDLSKVVALSEFIGQVNNVRRLKAFGDLYGSSGVTPEHMLLIGAEGMGKSALAGAFAKTYCPGLTETAPESIEKKGDLTAIMTSLDGEHAWLLQKAHLLRPDLRDIFKEALKGFRIDLVIKEVLGLP